MDLKALEESDSDDELPAGWEERASLDGQVYYVNHQSRTTHWEHPISGKRSFISPSLPPGWEMTTDTDGSLVFHDRVRGLQSHTDPRLARSRTDHSRSPWRQQFDSHSTALQVLANEELDGRRLLVTGGSGGIGFEVARAAALRGADVCVLCRSADRGEAAVASILAERPGAKVEFWLADLCRLRSVLALAQRCQMDARPLHVLLLNAGVCGPKHTVTEDGCELQFQVNHLSQLYLARLLLPKLLQSAPSRVVLVSSESHRSTSVTKATFDEAHLNLLSPSDYRGTGGLLQYGDTKLCNVLTARRLHSLLASRGVTAFAVHPGNMVYTGIQRQWWLSRLIFLLARPFTKSVEQAAATSVFVAFDKSVDRLSGSYFNNCTPCEVSDLACDPALEDKLWRISDTMLRRIEDRWRSEGLLAQGESPLDQCELPPE